MKLQGLGLGLVALFALAGCPDAEGEFCNFDDRSKTINGRDGVGTCENVAIETSCEACTTSPASEMEVTGDYLFTLSASIAPQLPFLFDADVTVSGGMLSIVAQPLDAMDRMTPVGDPFTIGPIPLEGGFCVNQQLPPLSVPGMANGVSGSDAQATVTLVGSLCSPGDFICGTVPEGIATVSGADIPINDSTWTLTRLAGPGMYPEPPIINCEMEEADPAP